MYITLLLLFWCCIIIIIIRWRWGTSASSPPCPDAVAAARESADQ